MKCVHAFGNGRHKGKADITLLFQYTSKLFKNIFYDVQTEGKGEINTAYITTLKSHFDTISIEWLKSKLFY